MTIEAATHISNLAPANPGANDQKKEGDDHIRLLKTVLQAQFPNFTAAAVEATVAELNYLAGVTGPIQTQIDNIEAGTSQGIDIAMANHDLSGVKEATFNGEISTGGTTGALAIDWTDGHNYVQAAPTGNITYTFTAPSGACHLQIRVIAAATGRTFTLPSATTYGAAWTGTTANKAAMLNWWYDGAAYHFMGVSQP